MRAWPDLARVKGHETAWRAPAEWRGVEPAFEPGPFPIRIQTAADLDAARFDRPAWKHPRGAQGFTSPFRVRRRRARREDARRRCLPDERDDRHGGAGGRSRQRLVDDRRTRTTSFRPSAWVRLGCRSGRSGVTADRPHRTRFWEWHCESIVFVLWFIVYITRMQIGFSRGHRAAFPDSGGGDGRVFEEQPAGGTTAAIGGGAQVPAARPTGRTSAAGFVRHAPLSLFSRFRCGDAGSVLSAKRAGSLPRPRLLGLARPDAGAGRGPGPEAHA